MDFYLFYTRHEHGGHSSQSREQGPVCSNLMSDNRAQSPSPEPLQMTLLSSHRQRCQKAGGYSRAWKRSSPEQG